jgi:hypothetical protein
VGSEINNDKEVMGAVLDRCWSKGHACSARACSISSFLNVRARLRIDVNSVSFLHLTSAARNRGLKRPSRRFWIHIWHRITKCVLLTTR